MPSMPHAEWGIHACEHVQRLAGLPGTPIESSEHKVRVAALVLHHLRVGVVSARFLRTPKERTVHQRCNGFARDLQRGLEATRLQSRLRSREAYRAKPTYGASLRAAYALFSD